MNLTFSTIRKGSRGDDVSFAQTMLYVWQQENFQLAQDGVFGTATEYAVKRFQRACGLTDDGIIGENTWSHLAPVISGGYTRKFPTKVKAIKYVQQLVNVSADGEWGPQTYLAIMDFQRYHKLTVDGIWGRQCWNARY